MTFSSEIAKRPTTDDVVLKVVRHDWHTNDSIVYKAALLEAAAERTGNGDDSHEHYNPFAGSRRCNLVYAGLPQTQVLLLYDNGQNHRRI